MKAWQAFLLASGLFAIAAEIARVAGSSNANWAWWGLSTVLLFSAIVWWIKTEL